MFPVKENFKNKYKNDFSCEFCKLGSSSQEHQFKCLVVMKLIPELKNSNVNYGDIFGPVDRQLYAVKMFADDIKDLLQ